MRSIRVDVGNSLGPRDQAWRVCVGSGHAYMGLRSDWQQQLACAHDECGFEYVRFHGLLCDDMGVYLVDAQGNVSYNWQRVDKLYDAILAAGVRPFVELGFMPYALASGGKTVFWWKANVTPPAEMDRWEEMIRLLVEHFTDRYGREEVARWYFEVWNEPDHPAFFSAGRDEYFAMYAAAARAVKGVCDAYRVGGPSTASAVWIPELIDFCEDGGHGLDFITYHAYGLTDGHFDEFGIEPVILDSDPESILKTFRRIKGEVAASRRPDLPIHVTEWSASYSSRDPIHDHYIMAPFILHKLRRMEGLAESMSYWTFSDVFEEMGPPPTALHGGFGLLNAQGLAKPSFHAYRLLNMLGDEQLACDYGDALAARDERGVQVLLWDYTYLPQDVPNKLFFTRDTPTQAGEETRVAVAGLAAGEYDLATWKVGYRVNDVYAAWWDMSEPNSPTEAQLAELSAACAGSPVEKRTVRVGDDGKVEIPVELRRNDVALLMLTAR